MRAKGQYKTSTRRCTPLGPIHGHASEVAARIRCRLDTAPRGPDCNLTVFVDNGLVYAVRNTSLIGARATQAQIVGVYTHTAPARDIADDLAFYASTLMKAAA